MFRRRTILKLYVFRLKIEDGKIKRVDLRRAMDTQQDTPFMLIYIREEDEKETVLFNIDGKFLTEHVREREIPFPLCKTV